MNSNSVEYSRKKKTFNIILRNRNGIADRVSFDTCEIVPL